MATYASALQVTHNGVSFIYVYDLYLIYCHLQNNGCFVLSLKRRDLALTLSCSRSHKPVGMPPMRSKCSGGVDVQQFNNNPKFYNLVLAPRTEEKGKGSEGQSSGKVFQSSVHAGSVLQNLNALRLQNKLCDVEIVAGDAVIKVVHLYDNSVY